MPSEQVQKTEQKMRGLQSQDFPRSMFNNNNNNNKVSSGGCDVLKLIGSLAYCRTSQSLSLYISPRQKSSRQPFPTCLIQNPCFMEQLTGVLCHIQSVISAPCTSMWKSMMNSCSLQGCVCSENRDLSVAPGYAFPRTVQAKNTRSILALRQELLCSVMAPKFMMDKSSE